MCKLQVRRALFFSGCLYFLGGQIVQAATSLTIKGVILAPPPCVINGGGTLDVPFGDNLLTTRVDGNNYRRAVPYTVACASPPSNAMTIEMQGLQSSFDSQVLATNEKPDLGVKLFVNGTDWPLNAPVNFTYPSLPTIEAVPTKRLGSVLTSGAFSAAGTLIVKWQ